MQMRRNIGTSPVEKQFFADVAAATVRLTYTYRNRQDRQSGDVAFFYIDLKDSTGAVVATVNQGQQTGLEFTETVDLVKPGGLALNEAFTVSFRPYFNEPDFYRILLVSISIQLI